MNAIHCRYVATLITLSLSLLLAATPALAQWPIKNFEVFVGKPATSNFKLGVSAENVLRGIDDYVDLDTAMQPAVKIEDDVVKELENYLAESATAMEAMGFAAPKLEPIVKRKDGTLAYRVYLFDFPPPGGTASYRSDYFCKDEVRPLITINAAYYVPDGKKLIDKGYQDLPHELFHAVQQSYPLFRQNCLLGDWIVEGTAQAIGSDIAADSSRKKDYPNRTGTWMRDRWGWRAYDKPLWVPSARDGKNRAVYVKNNGYGASSFWRYLGEMAATAGTAGTQKVDPDYRYLTDFFLGDPPASTSEDAEMIWLNDRLLTHPEFKQGLHRLYPYFVNAFSNYSHHRIKPPGEAPADAMDRWLNHLYPTAKCPEIRISEANPVYRGDLNILGNAATCFRLNLGFYQPMDIHVEISDLDISMLRSISVGTERGAIVAQPLLKKQLNGSWTGSRTLHLRSPMSTPQPLLIVSNVHYRPVETRPVSGKIEIAASTFDHSMLPESARPAASQKTSQDSRASRPANGGARNTTENQVDRVGEDLDAGMDSLNPHLANGTQVGWHRNQHPCNDAFVTTVCGPYTSISLSAVPGMFGSVEQTTGRGGEFGQFFSMLSGMAKMGPLAAGKKYQQALMRASELDGVTVNIAIPLIDYGYSGTFENAWITVSKKGGGHYEAIGPRDIQPGPGAEYALSGKVTIDEFTPSVMRGSFQGQMIDPASKLGLAEDATLPVAASIAGTFQVVGTWQQDGRIHRRPAEDIAQSVRADVGALSSQPPPGSDAPASGHSPAETPATPGNNSSGAVVLNRCDCSCNVMENSTPECETQCLGTFRACRGQAATAQTLEDLAFKPTTLEADAGEPFLRTIPDACELMDSDSLARAIDVTKVTPKGPHEWIPQALSQCGYIAPEERGLKAQLKMMFQPLDIYDSRKKSEEELTRAVIGFSSVDASEVHKSPGNIAIVTHAANTSHLVVLSGIYGFGWESEDFGSELVLTYTLTHPTAPALRRSEMLRELAQPQVAKLQQLAVTTHEGS